MKKRLFLACLSAMILFVAYNTTQKSNPAQIAKKAFEYFNAHQWDSLESLYASDAVLIDPAFPVPPKGPKAIVNVYREISKKYPDIKDEIINLIAQDNKVAIEFISSGTAKTGESFKLRISSFLVLRDGKIVEDATYYDIPCY